MTPRTCKLILEDAGTQKFWHIEIRGCTRTLRYGSVGKKGQVRTREFDTMEEAEKSFEKLVAEKLAKGYRRMDVSAEQTDDKARPEDSGEHKLAPSREFDLLTNDWLRVGWREWETRELEMPVPLDLDAAIERLAGLTIQRRGWSLAWHTMELAPKLSPEEGHFWFVAMTTPREALNGKGELREFANSLRSIATYDGSLPLKEANETLRNCKNLLQGHVLIALDAMFGPAEMFTILNTMPLPSEDDKTTCTDRLVFMVKSFRNLVLPCYDESQRQIFRECVREALDPTAIPEEHAPFPPTFYLAASLGMHKEVERIVSSWPDDRYTSSGLVKYEYPQEIVLGLGSPEAVVDAWTRLDLNIPDTGYMRGMLATTGTRMLDRIAQCIVQQRYRDAATWCTNTLARARTPETVPAMLRCMLGSRAPDVARAWLLENMANTVPGLIPVVESEEKMGSEAVYFLRVAKRLGHGKYIEACLEDPNLPDSVTATVRRDVLKHDEGKLLDLTSMPKDLARELKKGAKWTRKIPVWLTPAQFPPLRVRGRRLNDRHGASIMQAMLATSATRRHPLLVAAKEHCSAESRDAFTRAIFDRWMENESQKDKFGITAITHLGADSAVVRLCTEIEIWPGKNERALSNEAIRCLRRIGTDFAVQRLGALARKGKYNSVKDQATWQMSALASDRGLSKNELEDRLVPDCGLDDQGRREFSYGTRSFSFVLSPDLKPMLRDENGKIRPNPPKPAKKDDQEIAHASLAEWKRVKKQIKEVAVFQASRLEHAMLSARRWPRADFESLLVRHPLVTNLVQRVIWEGLDANGNRTALFRVTQEQDYADIEDKPLDLKAETIGIPHPLEMTEEERIAWGEILSDYELGEPFPQLGRPIYGLEPGEKSKQRAERFERMSLPAPSLVFGLERLGWERGRVIESGNFNEHSKQFPNFGVTAVVRYMGAVSMGWIDTGEELETTSVFFCEGMRVPRGYDGEPQGENILALGKVPPRVVSEVFANLTQLKNKAS